MSGIRPAWAPDGRILLLITTEGEFPFFGPPESRTAAICSVEPDGSALSVITAVPDPTSFSLSPDGRWLLI